MGNKRALSAFLLFVSYFLLVMPLILVFNDVVTRVVNHFALYTILQKYLMPVEIHSTGYIVRLFGIDYIPGKDNVFVNGRHLYMNWNCLGWQSLILYIGSMLIGLRGRFTLQSKLITVFMGLFGIFWVNIIRISVLLLLFVYAEPVYGVVFHDYFAAIVSILWLFVFWWFSYAFVLEEKDGSSSLEADYSTKG